MRWLPSNILKKKVTRKIRSHALVLKKLNLKVFNFGFYMLLPTFKLKEHRVLIDFFKYHGLSLNLIPMNSRLRLNMSSSNMSFFATTPSAYIFLSCVSELLNFPQNNNFVFLSICVNNNFCSTLFVSSILKLVRVNPRTNIVKILKFLNRIPFYFNAHVPSITKILTKEKNTY